MVLRGKLSSVIATARVEHRGRVEVGAWTSLLTDEEVTTTVHNTLDR